MSLWFIRVLHQLIKQALLKMATPNVKIELSYLNQDLKVIQNRVENYLRVDFSYFNDLLPIILS